MNENKADKGLIIMATIVIIVAFIVLWFYRDELKNSNEIQCKNEFCAIQIPR